jgi:hypothetical protein
VMPLMLAMLPIDGAQRRVVVQESGLYSAISGHDGCGQRQGSPVVTH